MRTAEVAPSRSTLRNANRVTVSDGRVSTAATDDVTEGAHTWWAELKLAGTADSCGWSTVRQSCAPPRRRATEVPDAILMAKSSSSVGGRSALLSTFVLDPPEPLHSRVWLVSFFITACLTARDTKDAGTTMLTKHLCVHWTGRHAPATVDGQWVGSRLPTVPVPLLAGNMTASAT